MMEDDELLFGHLSNCKIQRSHQNYNFSNSTIKGQTMLLDWSGFIQFMYDIAIKQKRFKMEWFEQYQYLYNGQMDRMTMEDLRDLIDSKCRRILSQLYSAAKEQLDADSVKYERPCQFLFHGADIILDEEGKLYLLEVNRCASISLVGHKSIKEMSKRMLKEMVDIELEIRQMKLKGERVDQDTHLDSVRLWQRCRLDYVKPAVERVDGLINQLDDVLKLFRSVLSQYDLHPLIRIICHFFRHSSDTADRRFERHSCIQALSSTMEYSDTYAEENVYLKNLETIKNIRNIVKEQGELHLPQMCVIGDQSSGKSSLLQQLTGIEFPVNSGICTKAPIYVHCIRNEKMQEDKYKVNGVKSNAQCVARQISAVQEGYLSKGKRRISKKEIKVTVTGPNQMDIIVIDLPGIIHHGAGKKETEELINSYIEPSQTLIIVVSEAKQDKEGIKALGLAEQADKTNERTLRVLTKCDVFDSEEAKIRAVQLVRDEMQYPLGAHAVICRPGGKVYSANTETKTLHHKMDTEKTRSGVSSLKKRLPELFSRMIKKNLPGLREQIATKLNAERRELSLIGHKAPDRTMILQLCQNQLISGLTDFEVAVSALYDTFRSRIRESEKDVTIEFTNKFVVSNSLRCPFFQGQESFDKSISEIISWWRSDLYGLCTDIRTLMEDSIQCDVECATAELKIAVQEQWMLFCGDTLLVFETECTKALQRENQFGTNNHYLTSKYVEQMTIPDDVLDSALSTIDKSDWINYGVDVIRDEEEVRERIKVKLQNEMTKHFQEFSRKSLHEQQQRRVFAAVKAHWGVEFKTFTDNILKIIKTNLIDIRTRWIKTTLLVNERILKNAMESNVIQDRRRSLKESIERMKKCQREINQIG